MVPSLHKTKTLAFLCNSRRKKTLFHKLVIFSFRSRSKCDRKLQLAQMPLSFVCGYTGPRTGDLCSDRETTLRIKSIKCATDGTRWGSRRRLFMLWGGAEASARLGCVQTHLRWAPFSETPGVPVYHSRCSSWHEGGCWLGSFLFLFSSVRFWFPAEKDQICSETNVWHRNTKTDVFAWMQNTLLIQGPNPWLCCYLWGCFQAKVSFKVSVSVIHQTWYVEAGQTIRD